MVKKTNTATNYDSNCPVEGQAIHIDYITSTHSNNNSDLDLVDMQIRGLRDLYKNRRITAKQYIEEVKKIIVDDEKTFNLITPKLDLQNTTLEDIFNLNDEELIYHYCDLFNHLYRIKLAQFLEYDFKTKKIYRNIYRKCIYEKVRWSFNPEVGDFEKFERGWKDE